MRLPLRALGCTLAIFLLRGLNNFAFIVQRLSPVLERLVPQGGSPGELERVVAADGAFGPRLSADFIIGNTEQSASLLEVGFHSNLQTNVFVSQEGAIGDLLTTM